MIYNIGNRILTRYRLSPALFAVVEVVAKEPNIIRPVSHPAVPEIDAHKTHIQCILICID